MFARFIHTEPRAAAAAPALYEAAVAQARTPVLYAAFGVPDTVTGRFEMVVLHTVLLLERLKRAGAAGRSLGQDVFDAFCRDMDQSLRELGFGDQAVPKRMKQLGESFYGRAEAYGRTFGDRDGLVAALVRNVFSGPGDAGRADALAAYTMAVAMHLTRLGDAQFAGGRVTFPDAAPFAPLRAEP